MDTGNDGKAVVGSAAAAGPDVLPGAAPGPGADEEEAAPGAGEDPRVRAADEEPASDGHILVDTGNDWEAVVGPAAAPRPAADEEEVAPSAGEDPCANTFSVGTVVKISSNGCGVREPTSAPLAGETSVILRFFAPLGAFNNRTSVLVRVDLIETPYKKREDVPLPPHRSTVLNLPADVQNGPAPPHG